MQQEQNRLEIIKCLMKAKKPLFLSQMSYETDLDIQLVEYHIKKLIDLGVVIVKKNDDEKRCYRLCSPFYDTDNIKALYSLLMPYLKATTENLIEENANVSDTVVLNAFKYLLLLFIDNLDIEIIGEEKEY